MDKVRKMYETAPGPGPKYGKSMKLHYGAGPKYGQSTDKVRNGARAWPKVWNKY